MDCILQAAVTHIPSSPVGNEATWTQTFSHNSISPVSSEAFGSCPVFAGTIQLGMPIPGPQQGKQVVDRHPPPDPAVPKRDLMSRALSKQRLGFSGKSTDMGGTSAPCIIILMKELSSSLSLPAESEDASYVLVLEQRPRKCKRSC